MSTLPLPKTGETAKYPHWEGLRDSIGVLEKRKYHPKSAHIAQTLHQPCSHTPNIMFK